MFDIPLMAPDDDPAVAPAEALLDRVATRDEGTAADGVRPRAEHALSICACVTRHDAPTWLIYDEPDGALRWRRIPGGTGLEDAVDARRTVGGHADPASVLDWLQGAAADPWAGGHGWGDAGVVEELGRQVGVRR